MGGALGEPRGGAAGDERPPPESIATTEDKGQIWGLCRSLTSRPAATTTYARSRTNGPRPPKGSGPHLDGRSAKTRPTQSLRRGSRVPVICGGGEEQRHSADEGLLAEDRGPVR